MLVAFIHPDNFSSSAGSLWFWVYWGDQTLVLIDWCNSAINIVVILLFLWWRGSFGDTVVFLVVRPLQLLVRTQLDHQRHHSTQKNNLNSNVTLMQKKKVTEVCDTLQCCPKVISSLLHFHFQIHLSALFTMICTIQTFTNMPLSISFLCTLSTVYYYKVKPTGMVKSCPWVIFREEPQNSRLICPVPHSHMETHVAHCVHSLAVKQFYLF